MCCVKRGLCLCVLCEEREGFFLFQVFLKFTLDEFCYFFVFNMSMLRKSILSLCILLCKNCSYSATNGFGPLLYVSGKCQCSGFNLTLTGLNLTLSGTFGLCFKISEPW